MSPRVVIIGAGNLGLACAARMASQGVSVVMLTGSPERWLSRIAVEDCYGRHFEGPFEVVSNPACVASADAVLLCLPGNALRVKLTQIVPYLKKGTPLMGIFSGDGLFFVVEDMLGADWPTMGFQRVPFICRTKVPYQLGGITGYKKELFLAHRNVGNAEAWREFFEQVFGTKTTLLENFYSAALINGNVVLHPARLMSLQDQIDKNGPFEHTPLFYEEWDDVASEWAIRLDAEVCAVAMAKGVRLVSFLEYYESTDAHSLSKKIRSISAFKGIGTPLTQDGRLDFSSRYVQSDIRIALSFVVHLAKSHGIEVCAAEKVLNRFTTV